MHQAESGVKNFSLYWGGGGGPSAKIFFSSLNMYQAKSWCQKFFPLLRRGGPSAKKFFSSLNMYQAKSGVKNFSLYWGGGVPLWKFFFPVWTCIKPNLVSKIFPFTWVPSPPVQGWIGYPPPHPRLDWDPATPPRVWTDKLKTVPSPILRMRAVNIG